MNWSMIILGVIMLVVLYYLYVMFFVQRASTPMKNLKYDTITSISVGSYPNPIATRFSYSIWINTNTIDNSCSIYTVSENNIQLFNLSLQNSTNLYASVNVGGQQQSYWITPNFPLQKWEHLIVSFDNNVMDVYLDGKFLKSYDLLKPVGGKTPGIPTQTSSSSLITFGGTPQITNSDIDIAQFERLEYPMDPQTAWNKYLSDVPSAKGSKYGLSMNFALGANKTAIPLF